MGFFRRKKRESLSELQGVPDGTFRCDVCEFVLPAICLCGSVLDALDNPPKVYALCEVCSTWLGIGELPQGLYVNLSEEKRENIRALHRELDIANKEMEETERTSRGKLLAGDVEAGLGVVHDFLERAPNLRELFRLRFSLLPENIFDLSGRLTRGEFVEPSEIKKVNKS
jgi:hypothetical protein